MNIEDDVKVVEALIDFISDDRDPIAAANVPSLERIIKELERRGKVIELMLPSSRLVWGEGGYSGSSGNWPLVEAYGELEKVEALDPDLYARIKNR